MAGAVQQACRGALAAIGWRRLLCVLRKIGEPPAAAKRPTPQHHACIVRPPCMLRHPPPACLSD